MRISPALIKIDATAFWREEAGHDLEALKASIVWRERRMKGSGLLVPLLVSRIEGVEYYRLEDGLRRFKAVQALLREGFEIKTVPVRVLSAPLTMSERLMLMTHGPKPLGPMEESRIINQLEKQGLSFDSMARLLDRSVALLKKRSILGKLEGNIGLALKNGRLQAEQVEFLLNADEPLEIQQERLEKELSEALKLDSIAHKKPQGSDIEKDKATAPHPEWMPKVFDPTLHYVALEGLYEWIGAEDAVKNGYSKKVVDLLKLLLKYCGGKMTLPDAVEFLKKF